MFLDWKKFFTKKNIIKLLDDEKDAYGNLFFDIFLTILILASSLFFILKTHFNDFNENTKKILSIFDTLIMVFFTIELFFRNYFAKFKKKYFFSIYNLFDLVAIIPFWFLHNYSLQFLRVFRILKIYRFFPKYLNAKKVNIKKVNNILLFKIISILFILLYTSSSLIYIFENGVNEKINSFEDALYLSIVTITTVGFGDIVPITEYGKLTIIFVIIIGIIIVPVYIGTLFRIYILNQTKKHAICSKCGYEYHDENAVYCKMCGNILDKKTLSK